MKKFLVFLLSLPLVILLIGYIYFFRLPLANPSQINTFVVTSDMSDTQITQRLLNEGYLKNAWSLILIKNLRHFSRISPGGYRLSLQMNVFQLANKLFLSPPDYIWITIPEGWRREQIGESVASKLKWSASDLDYWNNQSVEGQFFPDTYLVPSSEKPADFSLRLTSRFNENFSVYQAQFLKQNILWTTGLKVASLIQRETNNPADMPIISGIIWNRLDIGMPLQIDATLQYARGKTNGKWWGPVTGEDKRIDSPYNLYQHKGLPPTPICNPGLDAITAAANPASTDCLFYLHDSRGVMHCSVTYKQHLEYIEKYLRKS